MLHLEIFKLGSNPLAVISALCEHTSIGLVDAAQLLQRLPASIGEDYCLCHPHELQKCLRAAGAVVQLRQVTQLRVREMYGAHPGTLGGPAPLIALRWLAFDLKGPKLDLVAAAQRAASISAKVSEAQFKMLPPVYSWLSRTGCFGDKLQALSAALKIISQLCPPRISKQHNEPRQIWWLPASRFINLLDKTYRWSIKKCTPRKLGTSTALDTTLSILSSVDPRRVSAVESAYEALSAGNPKQSNHFRILRQAIRAISQRKQETRTELRLLIQKPKEEAVGGITSSEELSEALKKAEQTNQALVVETVNLSTRRPYAAKKQK